MTTEVSMSPRKTGWSATRRGLVIEHRVDVGAEPAGIECRRAGERGNRGVCGDELARPQGDEFADCHAIARHDERLATVEGAHDVAASVAQFALCDLTSHEQTVAPVLHAAGARPGSRPFDAADPT